MILNEKFDSIYELCDFLNENPDIEADEFPCWGEDPQDSYEYKEGYWSHDSEEKLVLVPLYYSEESWELISYDEFFD